VGRSDEERIAEMIAQARSLVRPAAIVLGLACAAQVLAAIGAIALGEIAGLRTITVTGVALVTPGPILLAAAWQLRQMRGWNHVFGGLMSAVGLWALGGVVLAYEGLNSWIPLALAAIVVALGLVIWMANLQEHSAIRGARSLLDPQGPRDPADRGVF